MSVTATLSPRKSRGLLPAAGLVLLALLAAAGCKRPAAAPGLRCSVLELRPNIASRYYDAVVRVEGVASPDPLKGHFQVISPSSTFDLASLKFTVEGSDAARLEAGDVFIVPLKRPDWKFSVWEGETEDCRQNIQDRLPAEARWHPSKTEAMDVARSIEIVNVQGVLKPVPADLRREWRLAGETAPTADNPLGVSLYQKTRGGRIVEQVEIQFAELTESEKARAESSSPAEVLSSRSECAKTGVPAEVAGHSAVVCDLEGTGELGWTYRYVYVDSGFVVAVDVQSDPEELGKTEEEKEQERRTDQTFLRYGYGPVGREEWQVMIELRMNRTGAFHKRARGGEIVDKDFKVRDDEFAAVEKALADNNFWLLESRSTIGPGFESFLSVRTDERARTVDLRDIRDPLFETIGEAIRRIVLPKVEENAMRPPTS